MRFLTARGLQTSAVSPGHRAGFPDAGGRGGGSRGAGVAQDEDAQPCGLGSMWGIRK